MMAFLLGIRWPQALIAVLVTIVAAGLAFLFLGWLLSKVLGGLMIAVGNKRPSGNEPE